MTVERLPKFKRKIQIWLNQIFLYISTIELGDGDIALFNQ